MISIKLINYFWFLCYPHNPQSTFIEMCVCAFAMRAWRVDTDGSQLNRFNEKIVNFYILLWLFKWMLLNAFAVDTKSFFFFFANSIIRKVDSMIHFVLLKFFKQIFCRFDDLLDFKRQFLSGTQRTLAPIFFFENKLEGLRASNFKKVADFYLQCPAFTLPMSSYPDINSYEMNRNVQKTLESF